jgi:hypothetical protein
VASCIRRAQATRYQDGERLSRRSRHTAGLRASSPCLFAKIAQELNIATDGLQAGLFSAVLTAFVVEAYQSLDWDYTQTTTDILLHISLQLSNSSTPPAVPLGSFTPSPSDVRINIYWFLGLVLSLAVALFSFLVKQWLREYISWTDALPYQNAVGIRQFRHEGIERWKLQEIITSLPLLLQLALILFFIGLVDFLWHLHHVVAAVILAAVLSCLLAVILATFLPAVRSTCPFRSPISAFMVYVRVHLVNFLKSRLLPLRWRLPTFFYRLYRCLPNDETWRVHWKDLDAQHSGDAQIRSIHYLWSVCQDERLLGKVTMCLYSATEKGSSELPLNQCWPILKALGGFYNSEGILKNFGDLYSRAENLPTALRQLLVQILLKTSVCELEKPTLEMIGNRAQILSSLIPHTKDGAFITEYVSSLQSDLPLILDKIGSQDGIKVDDVRPFLRNIISSTRLLGAISQVISPLWKSAGGLKLHLSDKHVQMADI